MLAEVARVKACFGATTTNACRKFHADYVGLRILCTYAGPGTDGVDEAKALLTTAYGMIMRTKTWAMGDAFTMADCAAAPALFYANRVMPFVDTHKNAAAYYGRLRERPSYVRALEDARPYLALFPE
jgi:glutathione S-transferase